ncbi:MAG: acyl-CoA dehydrogenase [Chloroflexi bacterium]|nr:acyl-CoA dehydrogenase [Chloroflexota bacterium]
MDFALPEEYKQLQALARRFVREELLPIEKQVEEADKFPDDLRRKLRKKSLDLGLWTYFAPVKYGGAGLGALGLVVVAEELGKVSVAVGQQGGVVGAGRESMLFHVNDAQKEKYLYPYLRGEQEFFFGLTEPNAGSDTFSIETAAVKRGGSYVLNGTKMFITMAERSDFGLVFAVTDPARRKKGGITCFFVDKDTSGYSITRKLPMLGRRGLGTYELSFVDCVVPEENICGEAGHGLKVALSGLMEDRLLITASCIGMSQRAYEMALEYAKQRVTFGQPLARRQMIQEKIVHMATDIYAARMMTYDVAWRYDSGEDVKVKAAMVKAFASRMAFRVVDDAMQVHGGYGYSKDLVLEMIFRDVRGARFGGGTVEVLESWAASQLLGIPFE